MEILEAVLMIAGSVLITALIIGGGFGILTGQLSKSDFTWRELGKLVRICLIYAAVGIVSSYLIVLAIETIRDGLR